MEVYSLYAGIYVRDNYVDNGDNGLTYSSTNSCSQRLNISRGSIKQLHKKQSSQS